MNAHKKVLCIIPTYNRAELIIDAIYSIINQTYPYWHLLIVHDGPVDSEYLPSFAADHKNITFIKAEKRTASPATLRNIAIEHALKSIYFDYVCFLDDDDIFSSFYMEEMSSYLNKHSMIDCVYCGRSYYNNSFTKRDFIKNVQHPLEVIEEKLRINKPGFLAMPDVMLRRNILENEQNRFHGKTWQFGCEDIDFFSKIYHSGHRFGILPNRFLAKVRWHNSEEPNHSVLRGNRKFDRLGDLFE